MQQSYHEKRQLNIKAFVLEGPAFFLQTEMNPNKSSGILWSVGQLDIRPWHL